jgi:hypothetical protein
MLTPDHKLNFLLGCSQTTLTSYHLARMNEAANLRKEIQKLLDKLREADLLVQLSLWFEHNDREALKRSLETEEGAEEWARRMIRGGGDILPRLRMEPEEAKAHRVKSSVKYQERNIAQGKCQNCPEPLDRNSVRYCSTHLAAERNRKRNSSKKPSTVLTLAKR